jgi:hypothetical protein
MVTINCQLGDVDAHGVPIRAQAMALRAEHQATLRNEPAMEDFWDGAGFGPAGIHHRLPAADRRFQHGLP